MKNIDPQIRWSFRAAGGGAFVAKTENYAYPNPVYKIASIAASRIVETAALDMPEGYDKGTLENISWMAGYPDQDLRISGRQAEELARIGAQILRLNEQGGVQPPLNYFEEQSVGHLVQLVEQTDLQQ